MRTRLVAARDLAALASHDAGQRDGPFGIADDEIVGIERRASTPSSVFSFSPPLRAAHDDGAAPHAVEIERVNRVAELEEDQVGDVDDVGDGAHAEAREPVAEPRRRGPDLDVDHDRRAVVRASRGVFDRDSRVPHRSCLGARASATSGAGKPKGRP